VLPMRLTFVDAPDGVPGKTMLQKEYARKIPVKERTAAALVQGWNPAMDEIITEVASDFWDSTQKGT